MRATTLLSLIVTALSAQVKPFTITGQCTAEVIQIQSLPCTTDEPCPLYLELASAEQVATRLLVTGNIHTGSQTLQSILLVSEDGGHTWTEAYNRIPGAILDTIQFLDFEAGWVSGHILHATPKDAFLLLTTDGGKTWRRRPVTSESRTGAIDQFWFDSRTHGTLSLDRVRAAENGFRYELWESMTGGESWSVRQVDTKPVPFSKPARESAFRIQSDSSGKVHRLERRDGNRWSVVSLFATSAGECKPPAAASIEEPPPGQETEPLPAAGPNALPQPESSGAPRRPAPAKPPSLRRK